MKQTYFPALDVFRFFAALLVMVSHLELILTYRGLQGFMSNAFIFESGKAAVAIFFALSGFLITKLAMESKATNQFNIIDFYRRRALRILPLYYMLTTVVFFVLPRFTPFYVNKQSEELQQFFWHKLLLYLALVPNFNLALFNADIPGGAQFWTIGIEVIFYLLIPFLILQKHPLRAMVIVFSVLVLLKYSLQLTSNKSAFDSIGATVYRLLYFTRLDCLLLGAIAALLVHQKHSWTTELSTRSNMLYGLATFIFMLLFHKRFINGFDQILYTLTTIPAVLYFTQHYKPEQNNIGLRILTFGGIISYSIYLTHFALLMLVGHLLYDNTLLSGSNYVMVFYAVGIPTVLLVSTITYYLIEKPFLRMKSTNV